MYHYDAKIALEELQEDALLPHPVKLRDMILRVQLGPQKAQLMNAEFQDYLTRFGELQRVARGILKKLAPAKAKPGAPPLRSVRKLPHCSPSRFDSNECKNRE